MVASLLRDRKSVILSEETVRWSLYGRIYDFWSLGTPLVCPCFDRLGIGSKLIYSVRVNQLGQIWTLNGLVLHSLVPVYKIKFFECWGFPFARLCFNESQTPTLAFSGKV